MSVIKRTDVPESKYEAIICYKFASRSRPEKFFRAIDNINALSKHKNYFILCSLDIDDLSMNTDEVRNRLNQYDKVVYKFGVSLNKIDAINRDLCDAPRFDVLVNMSDDMRFLCEGFDQIILDDMYDNFPEGDGALCYWDQGKETKGLMTMAIMDVRYFKRFGYIYFQGYQSLWCDVEMTDVAKKLGRLYESPHSIISHDHPANGIGQTDAQYLRTEDPVVFRADKEMYDKRAFNNFFLTHWKLSILVCTMSSRKKMFDRLMLNLNHQISQLPDMYADYIQVCSDPSDTKIIGSKRNDLLLEAAGRFIVFIDDDDTIMPTYVRDIVEAIEIDPTVDCIGMDGFITTNGVDKKNWSISRTYSKWIDGVCHYWYEEGQVYYRTPNHISPVKREVAYLGMFPEVAFSEDYAYSMKILPYLKREIKINKQLYHYDYRSK